MLTYYDFLGEKHSLSAIVTQYANNGNLAIQLTEKEDGWEEPYAMLTVNLDEKLADGYAYVDTNNLPDAEGFILRNDLGVFTGRISHSGWCSYPLYQFDLARLHEVEVKPT